MDGERHLHLLLRKNHEQHADYGGVTRFALQKRISRKKNQITQSTMHPPEKVHGWPGMVQGGA